MERNATISAVYKAIAPVMTDCGFASVKEVPRENAAVYDFEGEKGVLRLVFSADRIHLLSGETGVDRSDDTAFNLDSTFLFEPDSFDDRDLKRLNNEISEYLTETYAEKKEIVSKKKNIQTVSRTAAKQGVLAYDPVTLANKLCAMYPDLKPVLQENVATYGEFLCEDFFVNHANAEILRDIRENNPQRMKKLFGILGEIYEDGTNEVQSLIAVTILGEIRDDPTMTQNMIPYLTDTMAEPILAAGERLKKSRASRMRLENPPKYKPKKAKQKKGFMSRLMDAQNQQR